MENIHTLSRKVKLLMIYAIISSGLLVMLAIFSFMNKDRRAAFDELDVKRINLISEKGDLRMVISNETRQHPGILNGKTLPTRERSAGVIFFNSAGDECGGLVYDGNEKEAGLVLSVDKFRDDQIMQLQYAEDTKTKNRKYGLQFWDYRNENGIEERLRRIEEMQKLTDSGEKQAVIKKLKADGLLMEGRMFLGSNYQNEVGLFIQDKQGKPRIRLYVDKHNNPRFDFLDVDGKKTTAD